MIAILIESQESEILAHQIAERLKHFDLTSEIYMVSGLKTPELVVDLISDFNRSGKELVYMVISQFPGLAGMVSASSFHPVIALNSSSESYAYPNGVPALTTKKAENAVLSAVKILSLANSKLKKQIAHTIDQMKEVY